MFIFVLITIFIFIYFLLQKDNLISSKYLAATLIAYVVTIIAFIFYLAKDTYYYNVINNYFSLPKSVWKYLMFTRIPKSMIIRLLNIASLAVIYFGYCFSSSYFEKELPNKKHNFRFILFAVLFMQLIVYDPFIQNKSYILFYPDLFHLDQIDLLKSLFHTATVIFNIGIIIISILQLCFIYRKIYFLQFLRTYLIGEGICYTLIMFSYILIFWFSPAFLVKTSKIANIITYYSVPLKEKRMIYQIYPYYLFITILLCAFCIYKIVQIKRNVKNNVFKITKEIDAADTISKIFCHYIKNELLAITSEIELLQIESENEVERKELLGRCDNLYQRLDMIHNSTKRAQLNLAETDMKELLNDIISGMKSDFRSCQVITRIDADIPNVMIDSVYFEQAVKNIIENAIDSMDTIPAEDRKISISLQSVSNWIILSIADCGVGISKENMKNIFTPLYSSKPISKHWGIGLALTHRIIMAHEGKIEVDSQEKVGTNFRIMLPDMKKYIT